MSEESNALARAKRRRHKERAEAARLANRWAPSLSTTSVGNTRQIGGRMVAHLVAAVESVGQAKMKLRGL